MLKYTLAAVAAALAATPAGAQSWTGPYVGAHIGYGSGSSDANGTLSGQWSVESQGLRDEVTSYISDDLDPKGFLYGVQAGYDFQTSGNLVLGVEADFSLMDVDDDRSNPLTPTTVFPTLSYAASNGIDAKHMYSLRAKGGVAMGNTLIYVDGGWAWVKSKYSSALSSNGGYLKAAEESETTDGYVLGAGVEHRVGPNVSLRLDYSYTDQGDVTFANAYLAGSTFTSPVYTETYNQDLKLHLLRVGVNFRF